MGLFFCDFISEFLWGGDEVFFILFCRPEGGNNFFSVNPVDIFIRINREVLINSFKH